jgi:hypothetical protein
VRSNRPRASLRHLPTAPLAAAGLLGGYGVAVASGSRPLGGVVLAGFGLLCVIVWLRRDGGRTAAALTAVGLVVFALSHGLGLLMGGWAAVVVCALAAAAICWKVSDSRDRVRQVHDRAHPRGTRTAITPDQDRLDPRAARPGNVLLETVANVDRVAGHHPGQS